MTVGGILQLQSTLDYDAGGATRQYDLTIRVSDGSNELHVEGSVLVSPINEDTPTFGSGSECSIKHWRILYQFLWSCCMSYN